MKIPQYTAILRRAQADLNQGQNRVERIPPRSQHQSNSSRSSNGVGNDNEDEIIVSSQRHRPLRQTASPREQQRAADPEDLLDLAHLERTTQVRSSNNKFK